MLTVSVMLNLTRQYIKRVFHLNTHRLLGLFFIFILLVGCGREGNNSDVTVITTIRNLANSPQVILITATPGTVLDTTAPIITLLDDKIVYVKKGASYTDLGVTVTDNIDNDVTVKINNVVNTSVLGTYIITYTATDNAGNTSSVTRTVNVVLYLAISEVPFIDENFKNCVLAAKEENGWELISEVDELSCTESITNFSGLENLTSLTVLYLDTNNQISYISALANLTSLTTLYLASNPISDISALAKLTSLTRLYLNNNQINDIYGLANLT